MAIFTAIGAAIFGAGTFLAGATAFALQTVAGIGLSLIAKKIAGNQAESAQADASAPGFSVQGKLQAGGDVGRSFMVGLGATAGSLVYTSTWGQDGETPNAFLVQVIAVSDLPVNGLAEVWVNGVKVTLGGAAHADYGYPVSEYAKDGKDHLWVKFYDGTQVAADAYLVDRFGSSERPYQSTRIGVGVAYVICTALVEDTLFSGFPSFKFALNGARLYDVTKDSTAGGVGSHRWDMPSTWGGDGDHLPAVQIYNLLRGLSYGGDWLYGLQQMAGPRLPAANWIAQIDKCRELVTGEDGDEPQYRAGGEVRVGNQIADTIEQLLTTCQGRLSEIGGFYKLNLGAPGTPTFSFTDDDILSTEEQSFSPFFGLSDTINGVAATYPAPAEGWNPKPAPPLYRADLEVLAGNRRLMADVKLDYVPYARQVQELMQTALTEAQRARRHTFHLGPLFWLVEPGDIGEWTSARNSYDGKLFRCDGAIDKGNLDVILDLTEVDPADFDYDFETDFTPVTSGPAIILRPPAQAIVDFDAQATILYDDDGIQRRPAILLTWEGDVADVAGVAFEVRRASDDVVVSRGRTDNLAAGSVIITQSILPLQNYEVRGRYIPSSPRDVEWSGWIPVTTPDVRYSLDEFAAAVRYQVTALFDRFEQRIGDVEQRIAAIALNASARNWLVFKDVRTQLSARSVAAQASIEEVRQVAVDTEVAFAQYRVTVDARFGEAEAAIDVAAEAIATLDGYAAASYGVSTDVNGYVAGYKLVNGGPGSSSFTVVGDAFRVAFPGVGGGAPVAVFTVGNVNGSAKVALRGDMLIDGTITAAKISVGSLSAITANIGECTAGVVRSTSNLMRIDLDNQRILMSRP